MASKNRRHRNFAKHLHVYLLCFIHLLCILLLLATVGLQAYLLISPPEIIDEIPSMLGEETIPFRLSIINCFPFLMLPMLFLIIGMLYLQKYFSKNAVSVSDHISYFEKKHFLFGKKICLWGAIAVTVVSFALCIGASVLHSLYNSWFGFLTVCVTAYLYCFCAKQMRHRCRQYRHQKRKLQDHQTYENTDNRT